MSRHRDVRSMNYSDEYEGYDDVYGHSVEDDYCVSPGAEQFIFDRNKQQNISSFLTEPGIEEGDEDDAAAESVSYEKPRLSDLELAKLSSCIETIRNVIGDMISEASLTERIVKSNFNVEAVLNAVLKETPPKTLDDPAAPNGDHAAKHPGFSSNSLSNRTKGGSPFAIPKLSFARDSGAKLSAAPVSSLFGSPKALSSSQANPSPFKLPSDQTKTSFSSLADLTSHHFKKSNIPFAAQDNPNLTSNSPKSSFVIPKFSTRGFSPKVKTPGLVNPQEKVVSSTIVESSSSSIKETTSPSGRINRTIDLRAALRQKEFKPLLKSSKDSKKESDLEEILLTINEPRIDNAEFVVGLECELNLRHLGRARLGHANGRVSLFGSVLCKRWHSRRPRIEKKSKTINPKVVRFDFSCPSPDASILAYLRSR